MADASIPDWIRWRPDETAGYSAKEAGRRFFNVVKECNKECNPHYFDGAAYEDAHVGDLDFYSRFCVVDLVVRRNGVLENNYYLFGDCGFVWLNGESEPIHWANQFEQIVLTSDNAEDYLRFFVFFLRSGGASFQLIEDQEDIGGPVAGRSDHDVSGDGDDHILTLEEARSFVTALHFDEDEDEEAKGFASEDPWQFSGSVAYEGELFRARFAVTRDGLVEMIDDEPLGSLSQLTIPAWPLLDHLLPFRSTQPGGGDPSDVFGPDGDHVGGVSTDREARRQLGGPKPVARL